MPTTELSSLQIFILQYLDYQRSEFGNEDFHDTNSFPAELLGQDLDWESEVKDLVSRSMIERMPTKSGIMVRILPEGSDYLKKTKGLNDIKELLKGSKSDANVQQQEINPNQPQPDIGPQTEGTTYDAATIAELISSKTYEEIWWLNAKEKWNMDNLPIGHEDSYDAKGSSGRYKNFVKRLKEGHLLIGYQGGSVAHIVGIFVIISELDASDRYHFRLIYKFENTTSYRELVSLPLFGSSPFSKTLQGSLLKFDNKELILEILGTTELASYLNLDAVLDADESNPPSIATVSADSLEGKDKLEIMTDVRAFARVMASSSFKPPLAIALFGKWGSGKSFFMNKLTKEIQLYADEEAQEPNGVYCEGIAQIHFNAWSYLDANLWASIVTRIFEGLRDHFSEGEDNQHKIEAEKKLTSLLSVFKEQRNEMVAKKDGLDNAIKSLKAEHKTLDKKLKEEIDSYRKNSLKAVLGEASKQFDASSKIKEAINSSQYSEDEFNALVPVELWNNPKMVLDKASSQALLAKEFISNGSLKYGIFILLIMLGVWGLNSFVFEEIELPNVFISFAAIIGGLWKRSKEIYDKISPFMQKLVSIKNDFETGQEEAKEQFDQRDREIRIQIDENQKRVNQLETQIQTEDEKIKDLEYRLNNSIATEALQSFISKKGSGKAYEKHLGIVSIIRKDFEELSQLFAEHNDETKKAELTKEYGKPLQRIILYIDDLDRCPEDRVIEVLEAVNLLMAFRLFIVVVGVDQRWVKNSLRKRHWLHFGGMDDKKKIDQISHISASDYLEKIFQVPFHLKEAPPASIKNLVTELVPNVDKTTERDPIKTGSAEGEKTGPADDLEHKEAIQVYDAKTGEYTYDEKEVKGTPESDIDVPDSPEPEGEVLDEDVANLELSSEELALLRDMSVLVGSNPRAVKRFVNVYQIARSHASLGINKNSDIIEFGKLMTLLALPGGVYKRIYGGVRRKIFDSEFEKKSAPFGTSLTLDMKSKDSGENLNDLKQEVLSTMENHTLMKRILEEPLNSFVTPCRFIQRFTFAELI